MDRLPPSDDDRIYDLLTALASLDTYDVNLRDHPKAYEIVGAYAEEAVRLECERCAKLIEGYPHWLGDRAKAEIAAAIRARKEKKK